ncbi:MAG: hypothetical protein Faunusvirus3_12 [Faunusvirus sp.]|jgi:hypothetical protein|uniref:Receptor expression-enhancing protein n=1 Tax=Faunusvirus sp. TaxID=2487766 RepID=A0A3G4ZW47_9VIRU|nr:MAG: hypothetical protein Faunusvirus3_12 [Faunusvirus sp.]
MDSLNLTAFNKLYNQGSEYYKTAMTYYNGASMPPVLTLQTFVMTDLHISILGYMSLTILTFSYGFKFVWFALGVVLPLYKTFSTLQLEWSATNFEQYRFWMIYWIVFVVFRYAESMLPDLSDYSLYNLMKIAGTLWLLNARHSGIDYIYANLLNKTVNVDKVAASSNTMWNWIKEVALMKFA